jgi:hypothetical protein
MVTPRLAFRRWLAGVTLLALASGAWAFKPPRREALPELPDFDKRPGSDAKTGEAPPETARKLKANAPAVRVDRDERSGKPKWVGSTRGLLLEPRGGDRNRPVDAHEPVKKFLDDNLSLFRHGSEALTGARLKREAISPRTGSRTIVWEQEVDGIPVFEGVFVGHTTKDGGLINLSGRLIPDAGRAADRGNATRRALQLAPPVSAAKALAAAATNLGEHIAVGDIAAVAAAMDGPSKRQKFKSAKLRGEAEARLVWVPMEGDTLRLGWEVLLTSARRGEMFRVVVDAEQGEPLVRHCLTEYITPASFRVWTSDSPSPFSPAHDIPLTNQPPVLPRALVTLAAFSTNASPAGWIADGDNETRGNNVDAHLDRDGNDLPDLPRPQGAPFRAFDFPFDPAQAPTNQAAAAVVQLFYWNNWLHDRLYEFGFNEAAGNFQNDNFGRGGLGNDAVLADAQDGAALNNANFSTPPDGIAPRMQMFLFDGSDPDRDGSLDAEIIIHEYVHGLSNRRVGGGVGLTALQSRGMGEGWSDFYALALLAEPGDNPDGTYAFGGYSTHQLHGLKENYYFGVRRYPYSTDLAKNPLTFRDIDPLLARGHDAVPRNPVFGPFDAGLAGEVHAVGEVWCAILWEARASLVRKHGFAAGNELMLQLVTDGLNLSPANPSFVQARDAILQADFVLTGGANRNELWAGFAKRGLGFSAVAPSSSTTTGVQEAFDLPDDLLVTPNGGQLFSGPAGGPFGPATRTFTLENVGSNSLSWSASVTAGWASVSPANGTLNPGASTAVTMWINGAAAGLPAGFHTNFVTLTNHANGRVHSRQLVLAVGQVDHFTEIYDGGDNDLGFATLRFTPDGSAGFYTACRTPTNAFPTDPAGGTALNLSDDSFAMVTLTHGAQVSCHGSNHATLFIGSNGYLTFGSGDGQYYDSLANHFNRPRVSGLFVDLNPGVGGSVSWKQLSNRVAVTWLNVPEYGTTRTNSLQVEMFFDGTIQITHLEIASRRGVAGLSRGGGVPAGFIESDLSAYGSCPPPILVELPESTAEGRGMLAGQGRVLMAAASAASFVVTLRSGDTTELIVPSSVTIPAGQTSAPFDLFVVDDFVLDGSQRAVVTASAPGCATLSDAITVHDNEHASLAVSLPGAMSRNSPLLAGAGRVSLDAAPWSDVSVTLASSDPGRLQVPASVWIAAGQTSAVFDLMVPSGAATGGPAIVVTAHVENWTDGLATLSLVENRCPLAANLALSLRAGALTNVALPGSDPDHDPLVFTLVSWPTNGLVLGFDSASGIVTYRPAHGFTGTDSLSYRVGDAATNSELATVQFTILAPPDADGDGIPDEWELARGLNAFAHDGALDDDGDGLSNLQEYLMNSDPCDASSGLMAPAVSVSARGHFVLTWKGIGGTRYRVQFSEADAAGNFTGQFTDLPRPASDEIAPGTVGAAVALQFTDDFSQTGASAQGRRFYRVIVLR